MRKLTSFALAASLALFGGNALAAVSGGPPLPNYEWSFDGVFGTFDRGELQRGFQVYREVCAGCHSMDFLAYRDLQKIGYSEEQVKAIAAEYEVTDGPNDEGEMFTRAAIASDRFVSPYPNDQAARFANAGAYPPDLSLIAKAREGGPTYLKALLLGYTEPPEGEAQRDGQYYNLYYPGHWLAMPQLVFDDSVSYADGTPATAEQIAHDVSAFLMWAAEPKLEARHAMGAKVMLFLAVFTVLMFFVKRRLWRDVH